jgi:hypothetical protein
MWFSKSLLDTANDISLKEWNLTSADIGHAFSFVAWSVRKRRLSGGRQEGVDIIEVDNRALKFTVVPTRGLSVWSARAGDLRLGWDSPVKEIVHPQFVELSEHGGHGWLNGFGEWISRCGLESMGPPCNGKSRNNLPIEEMEGKAGTTAEKAARCSPVFGFIPVVRLGGK